MAYVYRITHKTTKEYYIGFSKGHKTIGVNYFTSSRYVSYSKETKDDWDVYILHEGDREECYVKEQEYIKEHINDPLNLNRHYEEAGTRQYVGVEWSQEMKDAKSVQTSEYFSNPAARQRASESAKRRWADPAERAAQSIRSKAQMTDAERERLSKQGKNLWADPAFRARVRAGKDPQRLSEGAKKRAAKSATIRVSCIECCREVEARLFNQHYGSKRCRTNRRNI